jgi:hypothetical protein
MIQGEFKHGWVVWYAVSLQGQGSASRGIVPVPEVSQQLT